jgi:hypothetical protein
MFGRITIVSLLAACAVTWGSTWSTIFAMLAAVITVNEWIVYRPDKEDKR